jgi:molecular chaperone DnaK
MAEGFYVGIDLGTTNSTAAVFNGERIELVRGTDGSVLKPSVVWFDDKGKARVGRRALRYLERDPENTRTEFKRLMGTRGAISFPGPRLELMPEQISAEVVRSLRGDVAEQFGFEPETAVVGVPALFEVPQSAATTEACRLAGFQRVELLQEPVAAALAAGWDDENIGERWLVLDMGGGTLDVSLLETRDGVLRVAGHDGDNFLGGRDFDWAVVDWAGRRINDAHSLNLDRANPEHSEALRRLKSACEEARIELTRRRSAEIIVDQLEIDGDCRDIELDLSREQLEQLIDPVIDRAIRVCRRLLDSHGLDSGELARIALVGGPTVTPRLRERLVTSIEAPLAEGLDPMTLVAQGAAIYAAATGLDARPRQRQTAARCRIWLQYPSISSDLNPYVVGKVTVDQGGTMPTSLRFVRDDGGWTGEWHEIGEEGELVAMVELLPKQPNRFQVEAMAAANPIPISPESISIFQGLTITDPPLSRTVGVALADDTVQVYFERGTALPARRTFRVRTVESIAKGVAESSLCIPIVQGEVRIAHLCRLVGSLEIRGDHVKATLPTASEVELTLSLDRGGALSAQAMVPALDQVFEKVAHLAVPEATPETLQAAAEAIEEKLNQLRGKAFRGGDHRRIEALGDLESSFAAACTDVAAALGGDTDAAQKAQRAFLEIETTLEQLELDEQWPELIAEGDDRLAIAFSWVAAYGTEQEQTMLESTAQEMVQAQKRRRLGAYQRCLERINRLADAAYFRYPAAWQDCFNRAASQIDACSDLRRARRLVEEGRAAIRDGNQERLKDIVLALDDLLPVDTPTRILSHHSGVR